MPDASGAPDQHSGTFVVSESDETALVLQDVTTTQILTVARADLAAHIETEQLETDASDFETPEVKEAADPTAGVVIEDATLEPAEDGIRWTPETIGRARRIPIERVDLEPTTRSHEVARDATGGELTRYDRAGNGEIHVLAVPGDGVDAAARDVLEDPATLRRAARMGVDRVEIRTSSEIRAGGASIESETVASPEPEEATGVLSVRYVPE